jgi:hypothetical protein
MVIVTKEEAFVIEARNPEEANRVDTTLYRFERFSESRGAYIFIRRKDK